MEIAELGLVLVWDEPPDVTRKSRHVLLLHWEYVPPRMSIRTAALLQASLLEQNRLGSSPGEAAKSETGWGLDVKRGRLRITLAQRIWDIISHVCLSVKKKIPAGKSQGHGTTPDRLSGQK